jgi:hypothetical protein
LYKLLVRYACCIQLTLFIEEQEDVAFIEAVFNWQTIKNFR